MVRPPRPPVPPARRGEWTRDALLALACAALAVWAQRRALGVYFHPDDLISMEWARGILSAPDTGLWRLLSGRVFFGLALRVFGTDPAPYHQLNLALHAVNVGLWYALARRWGASRAGAVLAAGLFGAARPAFSVLQQAVGIGELLAFTFTAVAFLAGGARGAAARLASAGAFVAALLSKEAVLLLPLVLLLPADAGATTESGAWRRRLRAAAPLLAVSALAAASLLLGNVRSRAFGGEAYAMAFGANLFHNLMTYIAWASDLRNAFFDDPGGLSTTAWHVGAPVALVLVLAAAWVWRRTLLPWRGLLWAVLALAPVLPLTHHTYATYLYAPLAGLALAVGVSVDALLDRRRGTAIPAAPRARGGRAAPPRRLPWREGAVVAMLLGFAATSDRLLDERIGRRYEGLGLPFDRQLRKSEMIRRGVEGLRRTGSPRRMVLYMPPEASSRLDPRTGRMTRDSTLSIEDMVMYQVLDGGRALRALTPGLDSVAFVARWTSAYAEFDLCANSPAGDIVDFGRGPDAHLRLGETLLRSGQRALAVDLLDSARVAWPGEPRVTAMLRQARAAAEGATAP